MRLKHFWVSLGLGLLAVGSQANAADWNNGAGSLKDRGHGAGVPIPAPVPVMETFKWYLRADAGGGVLSGGGAKSTGDIFGFNRDPAEGPAFGLLSSWFNNGFDTFAVGGVGAGAYLSPRLRADATLDIRTKNDVDIEGNYSFRGDPAVYAPLGVPPGFVARADGSVREKAMVRSTVALANFYWDLTDRGNQFVPYIGIGVGLAIRSIDRRLDGSEAVINTTAVPNVGVATHWFSGQSKAHQLAPAASATAGFGYTLSHGMVLDFNYRYTYLGSVDSSLAIAISPAADGVRSASSRLTIEDTHEHALRAGVRWNVW